MSREDIIKIEELAGRCGIKKKRDFKKLRYIIIKTKKNKIENTVCSIGNIYLILYFV